MRDPLCQGQKEGKKCNEMARWVAIAQGQFSSNDVRGFACNDCRINVMRAVETEGDRHGLIKKTRLLPLR